MEANKKLKVKISVSKDALTTDNIYYTVTIEVIEQYWNLGSGSYYYCSETGMSIRLRSTPKLKDDSITLSKEQSNYVCSFSFKSFNEAIEYKNDIVKTFQCFARSGYFGVSSNNTIEQEEVFEF